MREQDNAAGFPSIALPYGLAGERDKRCPVDRTAWEGGNRRAASRAVQRAAMDAARLGASAYREARIACALNGTDLATEMVALRHCAEDEIAAATAETLGLAKERVGPDHLCVETGDAASGRLMRTVRQSLRPTIFIAPRLEDLDRTKAFIEARPELRETLRVTTPTDIRRRRQGMTAESRSQDARLGLSRDAPLLSARQTVSGAQGFAAGLALALVVAAFLAFPSTAWFFHAAILPVYFACIGLRLGAAFDLAENRRRMRRPAPAVIPATHPYYSILVALRGETRDCVETLVRALTRLRWPVSKLQILLVCEEDDPQTRRICEDLTAGLAGFSVVVVPPSFPRTKPKALNFALPLATGDYVALFDAEDRPHPDQLVAAWAAFRDGPASLACVQAPLVVSNASRNWLTRHFAIEYAILFKGLLPWLAARRLPLPLGGTSNHFRRAALEEVGAWDSHNVAEDADLGIRLARHGHHTGTIAPPTYEDAPERWLDWRNQRTRWMKGWCQTWLVHMRQPRLLLRQLGARDFVVFQLLFAGMIVSSAAHTVVVAIVLHDAVLLSTNGWPPGPAGWLLAFDVAALVLGYGAYAALAFGTHRDRAGVARTIWTLPAYWTLIGAATLRAFWQLWRNPQLWEKTPHGAAARTVVAVK